MSAALISFTAGCAKDTSEIGTSYVSPVAYQDYSCTQLSSEITRLTRRVNELSHSINETAQDDAVAMGIGLILFWPALFFLEGDTPEAQEYARLKGEYEAVEQIIVKKNCGNLPDKNPFKELEQTQKKQEQSAKPAYPSDRRR
ncbi:MAG: metal ABC transporter ATP-binding protein [Alphaproteobacteria bacterium]|nr:MAG: metal ABC transporter ATP-binding protein [Alphaproteobacteria bacterium]TAF76977.1 MAG: metal ABC transporter ATP-binding protein [Alphaproteobacteria bacterium]